MPEPLDETALELLPADQAEIIDADTALDAAEASVLDDPLDTPEEAPPPIPYGRTAPFDYATGRFVRLGDGAIPWVTGRDALREWLYAAFQTGRGGCSLFSDEFGLEGMGDYLGRADPSEQMATLEERLRDCATVHDRVADIDDYEAEHDPKSGVIFLRDLTIITDEAEAVLVGNFDATGGS